MLLMATILGIEILLTHQFMMSVFDFRVYYLDYPAGDDYYSIAH